MMRFKRVLVLLGVLGFLAPAGLMSASVAQAQSLEDVLEEILKKTYMPETEPGTEPVPDHQPHADVEKSQALDSPLDVVEAYRAAFNAHDVNAMMDLVSQNVTWLSHVAGGKVVKEEGRAALRRTMTGYFKSVPTAQSKVEALFTVGRFVSVQERATWVVAEKNGLETRNVTHTAVSIVIYETDKGRVRRVWYFPAE